MKAEKKISILILLLLIIAIGALRFYRLDYDNIWLDESFDIYNASLPCMDKAISGGLKGYHSPVNIFMLFWWLKSSGNTFLSVRLPYGLLGIIAIAAFFWLSRILNTVKRPLFHYTAALFFSLSYYAMYYSREARSYIFVLLFSILSFGFCFRFLYRKKYIYGGFYTLFTVILLYSHFSAILLLAVQNFFYGYIRLTGKKKVLPVKKWVLMQFFIGVLYSPLLIHMHTGLFSQLQKGLLLPEIDFGTFLRCIPWMLHKGSLLPDRVITCLLCAFILIYAVKMSLGLIKYFRRKQFPAQKEIDIFVFLLIWAILPGLILFTASKLFNPVLAIRYFISSLIPLVIMAAKGFFLVPKKAFRTVLLSILLLAYAGSYTHWFKEKHKERYTDTFEYISSHKLTSDNAPVFYSPEYLSMPILFNLNRGDFKTCCKGGRFSRYLEKRKIYLYSPKKITNMINNKRNSDFFVLLYRCPEQNAEANALNARPNILKLKTANIYPFTIIHYSINTDKTQRGLKRQNLKKTKPEHR